MKFKKILSAAAIITMLAGTHGSFTATANTSNTNSEVIKSQIRRANENSAESSAPTLLDSDDCIATITMSTKTERVQSFTTTFTTTQTVYSVTTGLAFSIDDPGFVADSKALYQKGAFNSTDGKLDADYKAVPKFNGSVFSFPSTNIIRDGKVFIPQTVKYGSHFNLDITAMKAGSIDFSVRSVAEKVRTIFIPKTVTKIAKGSIINTGECDNLQIVCEASEAPSTWEEGWTDAKPEQIKFADDNFFNGKDPDKAKPEDYIKVSEYFKTKVSDRDLNQGITGTIAVPGDKTFYIGTDTEPLFFVCDIIKDGKSAERKFPIGSQSSNNDYDAVGKDLGRPTVTKNIDIPLEPGESVDNESIRFEGIYLAKEKVGGGYELDKSTEYSLIPGFNGDVVELDDFVKFKFDRFSTFEGFTSLEMTAEITQDKDGNTIYQKYMKDMYDKNESKIKDGKYKVRFRVTSVQQTNVRVVYPGSEKDGDIIALKSVKPAFELDSLEPTRVVFLIENAEFSNSEFDMSKIESVFVESLTLQADILNLETGKTISKSDFRARFGSTKVYDSVNNIASMKNVNVEMIITVVIFTLIYCGISVAYFYYKKHAFKNDEFRRVNPKSFIKNAAMGYLTLQIFILDLFVIIIRSTCMANSTAIYNPLDAYIIVFSVLSLLLIGYFIRFYIIMAKAYIAKTKVEKLKLNDDSDDDGTK